MSGGYSPWQYAQGSIAASNAADQAARLVYTEWQMRYGDEQLAMQKAQQAWSNTYQEKQAEAQYLGTYQGQQTQQAQAQAFGQGITAAGLTGQYQGAPTLSAQQQQWAQQQAQQQLQSQNALALLSQQSQLSGPADWLKYQALSANTPGGLRDMLAGFAGQYGFSGSAAQGTPGPATLAGRTQNLLGGGQLGPAGSAGASGAAGGAGGQPAYAQPYPGGAGDTYQGGVPAPNQVSLANWSRANPSAQQMMLGAWGAQGFSQDDVLKQLAASAPRYTYGGSTPQVRF